MPYQEKIVGQGPVASESDLSVDDSVQRFPLGTKVKDEFGNTYVYVQNGEASSALARGKCVIAEAAVDADTWSSDTDKLVLTDPSATMTAGAYSNWLIYINDGTGEGQLRRIKSNTATTVTLYQALTTALAVADSDALIFNPYVVNIAAASTQQVIVGVAIGTITAGNYGWVQCGGLAEVLAGGAQTKNVGVKCTDDTAGSVAIVADGNDLFDINLVGWAAQANTNADKGVPVWLNLTQ